MRIATAAESRELDSRSIREYNVSTQELMERAGQAVFNKVQELCPVKGKLSVVCGKGNNGGDGFVCARLAKLAGYSVDVYAISDSLSLKESEQKLSADAKFQYDLLVRMGQKVDFVNPEKKSICFYSGQTSLIVDAMLGTGICGIVKPAILEAIRAINISGIPVVSVDIPSGINADTGEACPEAVHATKTVTLGLPKRCFFQGEGMIYCGDWSVEPLSFPERLRSAVGTAFLLEKEHFLKSVPRRSLRAHKGESGRILLICGSGSMPGAAVLAAKGALRAGAGLVTLASVDSVCRQVAAQVPEVTLLALHESNGVLSKEASNEILAIQNHFKAVLVGPGLGRVGSVFNFLERLFSDLLIPCCIDADAINLVSLGVPLPACPCVLTPHSGEMARLLQITPKEVEEDRFTCIQTAVNRYRQCFALKGPHTLILGPGAEIAVNSTGNSGMASGGMGDVLSGMVTALLGQGLSPYDAASCAVFWHGFSADLCQDQRGPYGYLASEVADMLPSVLAKLW